MNESLFNNYTTIIVQLIMGKIIHYIIGKILQYNVMIVEFLLLLKGRSRSHVTCKALYPFRTKTHSNCSKSYQIEHKVKVTVIAFNIVITIYKYQENNADLNLF